MNERIKELAEQAGFSFKYKTAPDEMNPGHKLKDLEKFAELIVRECDKLIDEEEDRFLCMGEMDLAYAMANFRLLVKNHFEVKE